MQKTLEQVQLLIDRIQNHYIHDMKFNKYNYSKLLSLSEKISYPYGQAVAHAHLARYFQQALDDTAYFFHLEKAESIAKSQNYFDVLMGCYLAEGLRYLHICNEITALSIFLKGLAIALETGDRQQSGIFYLYIGEVFRISRSNEDAVLYYLRAVKEFKHVLGKEADFHKKKALISLVYMYCATEQPEKAVRYYAKAIEIPGEAGNMPFLLSGGQIGILLLKGKKEAGAEKIEKLVEQVRQSEEDPELMKPVYMMLMEFLLLTKQKDHASWCLERMDKLYKKNYPDTTIQLKELHVRYADTFHLDGEKSYEDFYLAMMQNESDAKKATGEGFKNLIDLYEVEKEREKMVKEHSDLEKAVNNDELTGINNRRYLSKLMTKALQDKQISSLGYVMLDVDFFKEYNDYYGHSEGDRILIEVAGMIKGNLPDNAYAGRYGGDEFACLFIDKSDQEIIDFVEALRKETAGRAIAHVRGGESKTLTLSIGIYNETNLDCIEEHDLVQRADEALYQAKNEGRNTYVIYTQEGKP